VSRAVSVPSEWLDYLAHEPETGMGYQVVEVKLKDGRFFPQVVAGGGCFTTVRGFRQIPFTEGDVASVRVNHKRWNFGDE
jgi:hypothetical protein